MLRFFRRIRYFFGQERLERELAAEIEFHRSMKQQELEQHGLAPSEARFAAIRNLGNITLMREEARAVWIWPWLESIWRDAFHAARDLRRQPGFAAAAVLTLAIGIGLNTSLFAFFNAFVLRPWPIQDPDRVVNVYEVSPKSARPDGFSLPSIRNFQEHSNSFSGLFAFRGTAVRTGDEASGSRSLCQVVSGNYYRVLGVGMELGRGFEPEEDRLEAPRPVVVLSHAAWKARFGSDRTILGNTVRLDDVPFTIIGVSSARFTGISPEPVDFTIPISALKILRARDETIAQLLTNPEICCSSLAGRLKPGATREQARSELESLVSHFQGRRDGKAGRILLTGTAFLSYPDLERELQPVLVPLFAGVLLVLLLACANVGNLLLARAAARSREIAVRVSLGAGRLRVVRQLLTEGVVIALAAGLCSVLLGSLVPQLVFQAAMGSPAPFSLAVDRNVILFTLLISAGACLGFALAPALHGTRVNLAHVLKAQGTLWCCGISVRKFLLGAQIFISVLLLTSAGLLIRSAGLARAQDPGFAYSNVSVASLELPAAAYDSSRTRVFIEQLEEKLGTSSPDGRFALAMPPPFGPAGTATLFRKSGENANAVQVAYVQEVTPGFFDVLQIPILAGRNFQTPDRQRNAILVNENMAKRFWPGQNPIGQNVLVAEPPSGSFSMRTVTFEEAARTLEFRNSYEIIGIVRDAYTASLERISPTCYLPVSGRLLPYVLLKDSPGTSDRLRAVISGLDRRAKVQLNTLPDRLNGSLRPMRVGAAIAFVLGIIALMVASIGLFGVTAYLVQKRSHEIGIRLVLGARIRQIIWLVLNSSSGPAVVGLGLGLAASAITSMLMRRFLFGVGPLDPLTYLAVAALVGGTILTASLTALGRATRIDPVLILRCD